jgi:type IV pilus assembly protein PilN
MIKINLLTVEKPRAKKLALPFAGGLSGSLSAGAPKQMTAICGLILVAAIGICAWWFWSLNQESVRLELEIQNAQNETQRLHSIISQVQQFEQRKAQLQQRVALIEQLRREQKGPVHMLDQISRALPSMLWLTDLRQGATPDEVLIDGRCTTLTGLSDFVANLEGSGYFRRSVEIVSSRVETIQVAPGELIAFSLKAMFQTPGAPALPAAAAAAAPAR